MVGASTSFNGTGGEGVVVVAAEEEEEKVAYVEDVPLLDEKEWSELESLVLSNDGVKAVMQGKQHSLY
ncbi:MAG: hypothetical protein NZ517_05285 [Candidatus Nitrosocaldus sp.]|nr:hypothetical protein [Candidatus Nitrosocaldus sp.]